MERILFREPWRGSQICGYQIQVGSWHNSGSQFCAERKMHGLYFCAQHDREVREECGTVRMAPGNAKGSYAAPVRLLWEPYEDASPVEPTAEETAAYAAIMAAS